jgi:hypothetical protein
MGEKKVVKTFRDNFNEVKGNVKCDYVERER